MPEIICPECGFHEKHFVSFREPGDSVVTVIAFWPVSEWDFQKTEDRWISRCHYRTVCNHAHWDLQLIENPDQAVIPPGIPVIGLEEPYRIDPERLDEISVSIPPPDRVQCLEEFEHPEAATYIFGSTDYQRPSDHFECDLLVGIMMDDIEAASQSPLYGNQVAALIWYDRRLKGL